MNLPIVQYARTGDGLNIAYAELGVGQPIVFASNIFGSLHFYQQALTRARNERQGRIRAGRRRTSSTGPLVDQLIQLGWGVVLHDIRGMGSSSRSAEDLSLERRVDDVEAVVDRLGLRRFVMAGFDYGAATAIAYTARHPEMVSHLVLRAPWLSGAAKGAVPAVRIATSHEAMHWSLLKKGEHQAWEVFCGVIGSVMTGFGDEEGARRLAADILLSTSPETLIAFYEHSDRIELGDAAGEVRVPTLVIHESDFNFGSLELAQEVASSITGARLVIVNKPSAKEQFVDSASEIDRFLRLSGASGETVETARVARSPGPLTPREVQVLRLIAEGLTNHEIAGRLVVSERTVGRHITNLYGKINARSKAEATAYAIRQGLT
ncbi:MAG TPA: alpha/beta fold hydrolase [Dehalococcoidia bacterium]|nr:alpha/beta fold hydrolase [Dehalococcoidia bacterium]